MDNYEIDNRLKHLKKYKGCIVRDEVNKSLKNGYYVVNLGSYENGGTHWVALIINTNKCFYFDSFGMPPLEAVNNLKRRNRKVYYNSDQLQDKEADTCGLWAITFIRYMHKYDDFRGFLDTINTEKILASIYNVNNQCPQSIHP